MQIRFKQADQNMAFPLSVWMQLDAASFPQSRLQATDPFGVTHVLIFIEPHPPKLTWIDFDRRKIGVFHEKWRGLPFPLLSSLMLGFPLEQIQKHSPSLASTQLQRETHDGFERYRFSFQGYDVEYSAYHIVYQGTAAAYFPKKIRIVKAGDFEMDIEWKKQAWNDAMDPNIFKQPQSAFEGFEKAYE